MYPQLKVLLKGVLSDRADKHFRALDGLAVISGGKEALDAVWEARFKLGLKASEVTVEFTGGSFILPGISNSLQRSL